MAIELQGGAYSFADVNIAITGPFINASLSKPGVSNEGAVVRMDGEKNRKTVGAGGSWMQSLIVAQSGRVRLSLLKTGVGNSILSAAYNSQKSSAAYWGQNLITINNPVSLDNVTAQGGAFLKLPDVTYSADGTALMEWEFDCGLIEMLLGAGALTQGL